MVLVRFSTRGTRGFVGRRSWNSGQKIEFAGSSTWPLNRPATQTGDLDVGLDLPEISQKSGIDF